MTNHFLMNAGHTDDPLWFSKAIDLLSDGVTEIGVHPGSDEPWRRIDTEDCFENCSRLCKEYGVQLSTFNDI